MNIRSRRPTRRLAAASVSIFAILLAGSILPGSSAGATRSRPDEPKPTIVLVHGAWTDASSWSEVTKELQRDGYPVIAPANPLRGVGDDAAQLATVLATIDGPVVLVGHSYGGMVTTNAATGNPNIKALVYIAAFAPDVGDTVGGLGAMNPGSQLGPDALVFRPHPNGLDVYIAPSAFRSVFAGDLSRPAAAALAAGQRPINAAALEEPAGPPAWAGIPSYYMVTKNDNAIPPVTQRFMADRAGATTVEINASHAVTISRPHKVAEFIIAATRST